jgi:phosphoglycolate phosphatase
VIHEFAEAHETIVIAGVTSQPTLLDPSNNIKPDYYTNKVADILGLLEP